MKKPDATAEATAYLNKHRNKTVRQVYAWNPDAITELMPDFEFPDWDCRPVHEFLDFVANNARTATQENANAREIPEDVVLDIEQLVDYFFHDEIRHCRATAWNRPAEQEAHIFSSLVAVKNWLEGTPDRNVQWWLKNG